MDKFLNDPAGRLYRFLEYCEQENPNDTILEGWRRYLELPVGVRRVEIIGGVSPLFTLPDVVTELLRSTEHAEENLEDYAPALDAAREAISVAVEATNSMVHMQRQFSSGDVQSLKACSRVLQRLPGVGTPTTDQLAEVRSSAQDLIDAINDATDLPTAVRESLLGYAHSAIHDIDLFKIGGVDALVRQANRFRGQAELSPGSMMPPAQEKRVWKELQRFAAALGIVAAIAHAPIAISADVEEYQQMFLSITTPAPAEVLSPGPSPEATQTSDPV